MAHSCHRRRERGTFVHRAGRGNRDQPAEKVHCIHGHGGFRPPSPPSTLLWAAARLAPPRPGLRTGRPARSPATTPEWEDRMRRRDLLVALCSLGLLLLPGCLGGDDALELEVDAAKSSIIGGAPLEGLPAVGALTAWGEPFCTGTLVGPRKVLTAAHCAVDISARQVSFVLGPDAFHPQVELAVAALQAHPRYDDRDIVNDIGLVTLAQDAPVAPMNVLARMDRSFVGTPLLFVGYGVTSGRRQTGIGTKRSVTVPIASVEATTFSYTNAGRGTCSGDSGGPAFYDAGNGNLLLAGVTSYGDEYCLDYGVDTRVDAYLDFVGPTGGSRQTESQAQPTPEPETPEPAGQPAEVEPNDNAASANRWSAPGAVLGQIASSGDLDVFQLTLPARSTLQVALEVPRGLDYDVILYSSSGVAVAGSENPAGQDEAFGYRNRNSSGKLLYLLVYGYDGVFSAGDPYQLTLGW
ncbi:MAG: trypsin-like serine protease [Deltaproteobacteria bacterium]|nr:trypsin-like serine protease [Deltaproteobacteria bacterium]